MCKTGDEVLHGFDLPNDDEYNEPIPGNLVVGFISHPSQNTDYLRAIQGRNREQIEETKE